VGRGPLSEGKYVAGMGGGTRKESICKKVTVWKLCRMQRAPSADFQGSRRGGTDVIILSVMLELVGLSPALICTAVNSPKKSWKRC
jgi:hypothetical protein